MAADQSSVLVIEDDAHIRQYVCTTLSASGYTPLEAESAKNGLIELNTKKPDAIVLDLGLPDMDGIDFIRDVRTWSAVPIVILSARDLDEDKITALDAGADDYVPKPFSSGELLARIRVCLRHAKMAGSPQKDPVFKVKDLMIDTDRHMVTMRDKKVHLTPIEFRLLTLLASNCGKVLRHKFILREIWGAMHEDEIQYLRGYMTALRRKIEAVPANPEYLLTEPGVGYRLIPPS